MAEVSKPAVPEMSPLEFLRWTWRQLTSMRTALILLLLTVRLWQHWQVVRFFRRPLPPDRSAADLISIAQPILSGDSALADCLRANLQARSRYPREFLWLVDDDDLVWTNRGLAASYSSASCDRYCRRALSRARLSRFDWAIFPLAGRASLPLTSPADAMNYHDLIELYFDRSTAAQNFWNLYVLVVGGLLAFSSVRKNPAAITTALVCLLFALFAYENLGALHDATAQRFALLQSVKEFAPVGEAAGVRNLLEPTLTPASWESVRRTHVISDVLTIVALVAMEFRRRTRTAPRHSGESDSNRRRRRQARVAECSPRRFGERAPHRPPRTRPTP